MRSSIHWFWFSPQVSTIKKGKMRSEARAHTHSWVTYTGGRGPALGSSSSIFLATPAGNWIRSREAAVLIHTCKHGMSESCRLGGILTGCSPMPSLSIFKLSWLPLSQLCATTSSVLRLTAVTMQMMWESYFVDFSSTSGGLCDRQKRQKQTWNSRDSIIDLKKTSVPDVIYPAGQTIPVKLKEQLSYWLHAGWFSNIADNNL